MLKLDFQCPISCNKAVTKPVDFSLSRWRVNFYYSHVQPEAIRSHNYGMSMNEFDDVPAVLRIIMGFP